MNIKTAARVSVVLLSAFFAVGATTMLGQEVQTDPQVTYDVKHDISPPLRELARTMPRPPKGMVEMIEPQRNLGLTVGLPGEDSVVQEDDYATTLPTKRVIAFDGVTGVEGGAHPPDTNGSVGTSQFVEITNFDYEVFDKATGKVLL